MASFVKIIDIVENIARPKNKKEKGHILGNICHKISDRLWTQLHAFQNFLKQAD